MERRGNRKGGVTKRAVGRANGGLVPSGPIIERLARIEAYISAKDAAMERRMDDIEARQKEFDGVRSEFIVLRAKWGMIAGAVGAIFAIAVHLLATGFEWVLKGGNN